MKVFIKKTKFGFQYKTEGSQGFKYFADGINTKEAMTEYFKQGRHTNTKGTFNEPEIVFVNAKDQPAKIYSVKLNETFAGSMFATVDFSKTFLLDANEFVPDAEKLEFLQDHSSMKQDQEASKLKSDQERIKYYLSNVTEETKVQYKQFINEKLTPDILKELCVNNARTYSLPAEIEFVE